MRRLVVSPDAAQDLHDIWEYIADDNLDAADRSLGKLRDQRGGLVEKAVELVVNEVKKDEVIGYLATPKVKATRP